MPRGERHVLHPRAGQPCVPADTSATGPAAPARGKHRPGRRPCAHQRSPTDPERRRDGGHPGGPLCLTLLRLPPREALSWLRPHQTCHPRAWSASRGGDPAGGRQRAVECDLRSPGEGPVVLCNFQEAQVSKAPTASHSDPEVSAAGHQQAMGKVVKKSGAPNPLSPSSPPPPPPRCPAHAHTGLHARRTAGQAWAAAGAFRTYP